MGLLKQFIPIAIILLFAISTYCKVPQICGKLNGRRMYLELGEHGILHHKADFSIVDTGLRFKKSIKHRECSLTLVTCPSCIVMITFNYLNISRTCGRNTVDAKCGCDYVWISERVSGTSSGEQFCGSLPETNQTVVLYRSLTRVTTITFRYSTYYDYAFALEYSSQRNRHFFDGYPKYNNMNNGSQFISSPFFPSMYPRDLNTEYVITCKTSEKCRVRLIFTDFQLSSNSLIEFFDWNGQRMHVATGSIFRPPLLISSGPSMVIRFYANGGTNLGFKASYTFLLGERDNTTLKPDTDCGGYVDNLGGGISMMNMLNDTMMSFDCFWIIKPPESYMHLKTQLYLKIINFSDFAGITELVVRQGMTSTEPAVESLRYPASQYAVSKQKEHIVPISQGFYVSLKGFFRPESKLAIVYSAFNHKDCYSGSDFLCRNLRCIPLYLICDGFDHCGDNSDETTTCLKDSKDRLRWSHTPNFFFPKIDRYAYLKTATIVFVVCSLGLITMIFTLIILLYRINSRSRNQRQLQTHLQTINNMLEEGPTGLLVEEIIIPDDPPLYEAPPDYEEILKVQKRISCKKSRRKSPIRRSDESRCKNRDNLSSIEENIQSASTSRSSQTTPQPPPIPNSPPPIYSSIPIIKITAATERNADDFLIVGTNSRAISNELVGGILDSIITKATEEVENRITSDVISNKLETSEPLKYFTCIPKRRFKSVDYYNTIDEVRIRKRRIFSLLSLNKRLSMSDSELLGSAKEDCSVIELHNFMDNYVKNSCLRRSISIENLCKFK